MLTYAAVGINNNDPQRLKVDRPLVQPEQMTDGVQSESLFEERGMAPFSELICNPVCEAADFSLISRLRGPRDSNAAHISLEGHSMPLKNGFRV